MRGPASELPIVFAHVTFRRGAMAILDDLSVSFSAGGGPTAIVGPNGSGKTTLLHLAMGLITPTAGRVTWDGREHTAPTRRAIMFQRPAMLRRSAAGNIRYVLAAAGMPRGGRGVRTEELLTLVGLDGRGGRPARRLSGGEQQRLALARALARDPAVLLLDEPTASLDPAATKAIEDVIRAIAASGIRVILSTHDLASARRVASDVVLVNRGRLIEHSDAETFFSAPRTSEARRFAAGELLV
jgi:tungstate transport system ATP-binding protein